MASYIDEMTNEARIEYMTDRIAALEADNAERNLRGRQEVVTLEDGTEVKQIEIIEKNTEQIEYLNLQRMKVQRAIADQASKNPIAYVDHNGDLKYRPAGFVDKPLYPDQDAGERLMGRSDYARLSPQQKAQIKDLRQSDLDSLPLSEIFGRNSIAKKAIDLQRKNPGLYRAAKQKAIAEGIF